VNKVSGEDGDKANQAKFIVDASEDLRQAKHCMRPVSVVRVSE